MINLDKATIEFIYILCSIMVCGLTLLIWRQNRHHIKGLSYWVIAHFLQLAGVILLGAQNRIHMFYSSFLAVVLIFLGFHLFIISFESYVEERCYRIINQVMISLGASTFLYFTVVMPAYRWRIVSFSTVMIVMSLEAIQIFVRQMRREKSRYYGLMIVTFCLYFMNYSVRVFNALTGDVGHNYTNASQAENYFVAVSMLAGILMMVGLIHMINGKLIHDLYGAVHEKEKIIAHTIDIAETDNLTGLMNRMKSESVIHTMIVNANDCKDDFLVMLIDVDYFKVINDRYGHTEGDRVLKEFSEILKGTLRRQDYAGRWGGDEFIVILHQVDLGDGLAIAEKINENVSRDILLEDHQVTLSIGIKHYEPGENLTDLIMKSDKALYAAKEKGRNRCHVYEPSTMRVVTEEV